MRQMNPGAQTALRRCLEPHVAAMAARHVAGDRQAKADATGRRVARRIEPHERPEHACPIGRRDAGPIVIDQNIDPVRYGDPGQPDMTPVAARIANQIGQAAAQRIRPNR